MSNTYEQKCYLKKKLSEWELFDESNNVFIEFELFDSNIWFNPNIHPNNFIPLCSSCKNDYDTFKTTYKTDDKIKLKHPSGCIWYDYFVEKMKLYLKQNQ